MPKWDAEDPAEQELAPPVSVRLPAALMKRVEKLAAQYGISVAQQLRAMMRIGAQVQEMYPRSLEETIDLLQRVDFEGLDKARGTEAIHLLRGRIGLVISELDLGVTAPTFFLSATPLAPETLEVPTIFSSKNSEIVKLLEDPPRLRNSGFDLFTGSPARIIGGHRLKSLMPHDKTLNLWDDGTILFAADGGTDFLCWGRSALTSKKAQGAIRINQLALIESTYLFVLLVSIIFDKWVQPKPTKLQFQLGLLHMTVEGSRCTLSPGPLQEVDFGRNLKEAPESSATFSVEWDNGQIDPAALSFDLIRHVYAWFGIMQDQIPYTIQGKHAIDLEAIKNPKRHFSG